MICDYTTASGNNNSQLFIPHFVWNIKLLCDEHEHSLMRMPNVHLSPTQMKTYTFLDSILCNTYISKYAEMFA